MDEIMHNIIIILYNYIMKIEDLYSIEYIDWPLSMTAIIIPKNTNMKLANDITLTVFGDAHISANTCKKQKIRDNMLSADVYIKTLLHETNSNFFIENNPYKLDDNYKESFVSKLLNAIFLDNKNNLNGMRRAFNKQIARVHYVDIRTDSESILSNDMSNYLTVLNGDYVLYYKLVLNNIAVYDLENKRKKVQPDALKEFDEQANWMRGINNKYKVLREQLNSIHPKFREKIIEFMFKSAKKACINVPVPVISPFKFSKLISEFKAIMKHFVSMEAACLDAYFLTQLFNPIYNIKKAIFYGGEQHAYNILQFIKKELKAKVIYGKITDPKVLFAPINKLSELNQCHKIDKVKHKKLLDLYCYN